MIPATRIIGSLCSSNTISHINKVYLSFFSLSFKCFRIRRDFLLANTFNFFDFFVDCGQVIIPLWHLVFTLFQHRQLVLQSKGKNKRVMQSYQVETLVNTAYCYKVDCDAMHWSYFISTISTVQRLYQLMSRKRTQPTCVYDVVQRWQSFSFHCLTTFAD